MTFSFKKNDGLSQTVMKLYGNKTTGEAFPVLGEEDERKAVYHLLYEDEPDKSEWKKFLELYVSMYPLNGLSTESLFNRLDVPEVRQIAAISLKKYGSNEKEGKLVCEYLRKCSVYDDEFGNLFCSTARVYFNDVYVTLLNINQSAAEAYKKATDAYMKNFK